MEVTRLNCDGAEQCIEMLRAKVAQLAPTERGAAGDLLDDLAGFVETARALATQCGLPTSGDG